MLPRRVAGGQQHCEQMWTVELDGQNDVNFLLGSRIEEHNANIKQVETVVIRQSNEQSQLEADEKGRARVCVVLVRRILVAHFAH